MMRFPGFIGATYNHDSKNIEAQRCINLFPELIESGTGKEGEVASLRTTPGKRNILEIGNGPIRCLYRDPRGTVFVASGNKLYKVAFSGATWSSTQLGSFNTSQGPVRAASNRLVNGDSTTVFVDGSDSYTYEYEAAGDTEDFDDYAGRGYQQVDGATHVEFIDGFFVFNEPDTGVFKSTEWGDFSVDPLSSAAAEGDPDNILALIANHRDLWIFSENSTEIWSNAGNPDFPFERIGGAFIEVGIVAPFSLAKMEGLNFWLGRDKTGYGKVYAAQGTSFQRISTHPIEQAIRSYDIDEVTTADAFCYSDGGHSFYQLNFPDATFVYDLSTKLWHERAYNNQGVLERDRANLHVFVPELGFHLLGDYEDNRIYLLDNDYAHDDDAAIIRRRSAPHVSKDMKRLKHKRAQLDVESGVGLDGGVQGSDPKVMLDWSDDGGHNWSNEHWTTLGKIGEYKSRSLWRQLGMSRDRVYRVTISDPVKVNLLGMQLDVEEGNH